MTLAVVAPFRFTWKPTAPGRTADYTGRDPDNPRAFARVYLTVSGGQRDRPWFWTCADEAQIADGYAATRQQAADLATVAYMAKRPPAKA